MKKLLQAFRAMGLKYTCLVLAHRLVNDLASIIARMVRFDSQIDPTKRVFDAFLQKANTIPGARILELGSRNISHKKYFHGFAEYVGFDVNAGPNVDLAGDIHQLSRYFPENNFDVVYAISVFEHLAMPWKAILEINKVLKPGGILFIFTPQTYPPHALPWDFWRFSKAAASILLNDETGFCVEECAEGIPCSIISLESERGRNFSHRWVSFMGVAVIAVKSHAHKPGLAWNVETADIRADNYPEAYVDKSYGTLLDYLDRRTRGQSNR